MIFTEYRKTSHITKLHFLASRNYLLLLNDNLFYKYKVQTTHCSDIVSVLKSIVSLINSYFTEQETNFRESGNLSKVTPLSLKWN